MDGFKKGLCIYAGGAAGVAAAMAAVTVLGVAMPVALCIGYAVAGGSIAAAVNMDE